MLKCTKLRSRAGSSQISCELFWRVTIGILAAVAAQLSAADGPRTPPTAPLSPIPFHQSFQSGSLDPAWKVDVSQDNTITVADGGLRIAADVNTYAHIERPLEKKVNNVIMRKTPTKINAVGELK